MRVEWSINQSTRVITVLTRRKEKEKEDKYGNKESGICVHSSDRKGQEKKKEKKKQDMRRDHSKK